ncbi:SusC/RagA family TonB-linked outer membrane protein [Pararcticibacter amylolyticus]|uniref:SusC/RagA family TonB-linked outer membrane protein n=1 Tax=Pararcticibacter amylolyticus TaxID=2173175 RepID=A0A2U2PIV6_9SPHI|nr:SusC/RagA family TonB-linked outer membrane protein [Pararcticibacter amylolyticus]PWG81310.1 SusC/RagA family TonB-linked outer membrane protein [Pararcticibacter amylolyticus]
MKKRNIKTCFVLIAAFFTGLTGLHAQIEQDSLVNVAFRTIAREDLTGTISIVNVPDLLKKSYGTYSLDNLQSFVGGYTGNIWGQAPLILVDGIPRRASDIRMVEVESITVLKGASSVILYGSSASRGAILITTKRGSIKPLTIDVRANTGLFVPKSYPNYLNAADYMTLYNEALTNDGIATSGAGYTQEAIDNTRSGTNPYRYPDIDFFSSEYLKKAYSRSDITTEISGGDKNARYYTNLGLAYNNSLMKYGEQKKNNDFAFNVRGNVDMDIAKWLKASADAVAVISNNYAGRGSFWSSAATIAPNFNRFSPFIPISMLDPENSQLQAIVKTSNHIIDGKYLLGGQSTNPTNVFSDMLASGYIKTRNRTFMYNLNATADLRSVLEGLSFTTANSMDYTSVFSEAYQLPYRTYRPTWATVNGQDLITALEPFGEDKNSTNEFIGRSTYTQTMSVRSQFNYERNFSGKHNVTAALLGWWYKRQFSSDPDNEGGSDYQPFKNTNLGFQAGYNYQKKYYADFSAALIHSAKLPPGKRNALSPAVTLGWRVSDEEFFKNTVSFVDNLKITASYASINQDIDITGYRANNTSEPVDHYLYQGYYSNTATFGGWYQWRDGVAGGRTTLSGQAENPDLTFVKRKEFRVGMEGALWKNLVSLDVNYFSQTTDGLLARGVSIYPAYFSGSGDFRPWINFNKDKRSGLDFSVNLNKNIAQVQYSLGLVGMIYSSKVLRRDELPEESYLARTGRSLDAYYGYISEGLFENQAEIDNHARQTFGPVKPGDIKYKDINNDGLIDSRDQIDLGHTGWAASPFTYGLNLTVKWKNLTFFALGSGNRGAIGFKNSSYYWVGGTGKYSDVVWGRWTESTKSNATYPRLTTNSSNNFRNSTFWMYKTNRFDLNRVQLTYDFNQDVFKNSFIHGLSLYVQGDNLLVISRERELMETNIGLEPQTRFFNLGIRTSF